VWTARQQALNLRVGYLDGVSFHRSANLNTKSVPVVDRSVVRTEQRPGKKRVPIVGRLSAWGRQQHRHYSGWGAVRGSYLSPLLSRPLPHFEPEHVTPETVFKAWCILGDLAEVLLGELPRSVLSSRQAVHRFALPIDRATLAATLADGLNQSRTLVEQILDFLTIDATDMSRLFNRGFWSAPLVANDNGKVLYLLSAVLLTASPLRSVESWLERGGATTGPEAEGRQFEQFVRAELNAAIQANGMLSDTECPLDGLPNAAAGEEIDALIRIGQTILTIEAKEKHSG
jgi:hypothetical protein